MVTTVLGRLAGSSLVRFLAFVAALSLVIVLLARAPEGCDCGARTAQVVLLAVAGLLAVVGTALQAGGGRAGAVLVGTAVLLIALSGLVDLW